jgi:hypothetical protein
MLLASFLPVMAAAVGLLTARTMKRSAGGDITDREIDEFAGALSPDFVNFTLVLDSCHSGGVFDPPGETTIRTQAWSADQATAFAQSCRLIVPHVCLADPSGAAG